MLRVIALGLFILVATSTSSFAEQRNITKDMVADKYTKLEKLLNDRSSYTEKIKFLHNHISEDALFRLTVTNPTAAQSGKSPVMEMNKQDYINTYIQGPRFVDNYQMDIKTTGFEYNREKHHAFSLDVITESGTMMSKMNDGKAFVSRTTCRTRHEMQQNTLVATASECHTAISFEEHV